jgi:hypothetical protein
MTGLLLAFCVAAHGATGTVLGRVTNDLDSAAIAGAVVTLWQPNPDSTLTDSLGFYSMKLSPGRYLLRVSFGDYQPAACAVTVDSGQRTRLDFQIHTVVEMPPVDVHGTKEYMVVARHNDSVHDLLRGLRFARTREWARVVHGKWVPDSAAIRHNNAAATAACAAFARRRGGFLRRPSSYYLQAGRQYLLIGLRGCRFIEEGDERNRSRVHSVDSIRATPFTLESVHVVSPSWAALPQYLPLRLDVHVDGERWLTVVFEDLVLRM